MSRRLILPAATILIVLSTLGLGAWLIFGPVTKHPVELRMERLWMYTHPRPQRYAKYQVNERIDYELRNTSKSTIEVRMIGLQGGPRKPMKGPDGKGYYAYDHSRMEWTKLAPGATLKGWMLGHPTVERSNPDWKAYSLNLVTQWRYVGHIRDTFRKVPEVHQLQIPDVEIPPLSAAPEPSTP